MISSTAPMSRITHKGTGSRDFVSGVLSAGAGAGELDEAPKAGTKEPLDEVEEPLDEVEVLVEGTPDEVFCLALVLLFFFRLGFFRLGFFRGWSLLPGGSAEVAHGGAEGFFCRLNILI